jgi:hypothetical protein
MLASFSITLVRKDGTLQKDTLIIDPFLPHTIADPAKELNSRFYEALRIKYPKDYEQYTGHRGYVLNPPTEWPADPAQSQTDARTP